MLAPNDPEPEMPPRVHPCLCGFESETYPPMKRHRRRCDAWQKRPNPRDLANDRLRETRKAQTVPQSRIEPCILCGKRPDHHDNSCPNSQGEVVRREALLRHEIDPKQFEVFLRVLARRYEGGETP